VTRLDDLLTYDDHARRSRPRRAGTARKVLIPVVVALTISVVAHLVLNIIRVGVPFALVLATAMAIVALRYTLRALEIQRLPQTLLASAPVRHMAQSKTDGMSEAARSWNNRLEFAHDDSGRLDRLIRPAFVEIIDERVRLGHGITRASDPDLFRQLVGPELWKFMTMPVPRRFSPHMIATLVAQMEEL
jgi:hypothetical protein